MLIMLFTAGWLLSPNLSHAAGTIGDTDNDGVPDIIDIDDDNDTIPDDAEGTADIDGDGIINCLDLDSDNDGIPDLFEALASNSLIRLLDTDGNGVVDSTVAVGNNGLADIVEQFPDSGTTLTDVSDLDGDGIPDHHDLDVDNDGVPDVIEAGSSDSDRDGKYDLFLDLNGDGIADRLFLSPIAVRDTDQDGVADFRDIDSDQDGLTDRLETSGVDTDSDGRVDDFVDLNVDGLNDAYTNGAGGLADTDQDGFPDYRDTDSDGDGVSDAEEAFSNPVPTQPVVPTTPFNPRPTQFPQAQGVTLETGESGSVFGCAITSRGGDPTLLVLLLLATFGLLKRMKLGLARVGQWSLASVAVLLSACAATEPYAGVGLGASFLNANTSNLPLTQDQSFSGAGQVTLGTAISPRLAVEARAADLGEATFTDGRSVGYQVADLSALYNQRFGQFSGFGRLGMGALFNDGDIRTNQKNPQHLLVGAGVDYAVTPSLTLRAEWQGHDADVMHSQFSVLYRFGRASGAQPVVVATKPPEQAEPAPKPAPVEAPSSPPVVVEPVEPPVVASSAPQAPIEVVEAVEPVEVVEAVEAVEAVAPAAPAAPVAPDNASQGLQIERPTDEQVALAEPESLPKIVTKPESTGSGRLKPLINVPVEKKITPAPIDSDKDGIVDASDKCSGTEAGTAVLANGCALFGDSVPGLSFFPTTDRLTDSAKAVLDDIADALSDESDLRVTVAAHTAPAEDANAAMFLTRRRTIAIIRYLSDKGIDAERLRPEAFGDTQPLVDAAEPSENDRVVLTPR